MISLFKSTSKIISRIEEFMNVVDESSLIFKEGIENYLADDSMNFQDNIEAIDYKEGIADDLRREIEDSLYRYSLIPDFRGDVMQLLERLDDLIDTAKEILSQFDTESPDIPGSLHREFIKLSDLSVKSVEAAVMSSKAFFRDVKLAREKIHRVYFYEKEADKISADIKRIVFKDMKDLDLSHKQHLRYFAYKIEELSNIAEDIADMLRIFVIKRSV